ncbi:response regulator [Granulicatella sp. zg-ZJ]|nr:response regulator [Granulicatella sp. zg-ZJ]
MKRGDHMISILILEDEEIIANGLSFALQRAGYTTHIASNIKQAQHIIADTPIQLALLDIMLPDGNGIDFAQTLPNHIKFIFLSAIDEEDTIVNSFHLGSQDYITKPFRLPIVLARIQAIISRYQLEMPSYIRVLHHLQVDTQHLTVTPLGENEPIKFSKNEHKLFFYFFKHINQVLTREQILAYMWDNDGTFVNDNTLTVTLKRLRQKIESDTLVIETLRGIGYRLKGDIHESLS